MNNISAFTVSTVFLIFLTSCFAFSSTNWWTLAFSVSPHEAATPSPWPESSPCHHRDVETRATQHPTRRCMEAWHSSRMVLSIPFPILPDDTRRLILWSQDCQGWCHHILPMWWLSHPIHSAMLWDKSVLCVSMFWPELNTSFKIRSNNAFCWLESYLLFFPLIILP